MCLTQYVHGCIIHDIALMYEHVQFLYTHDCCNSHWRNRVSCYVKFKALFSSFTHEQLQLVN